MMSEIISDGRTRGITSSGGIVADINRMTTRSRASIIEFEFRTK